MDDNHDKENKNIERKRNAFGFLQRHITNVGDVLSPIWIRRAFQIDNGGNWFVLGSRYRFLFNFRMFLVVLYFTYETFK
jgi:hypothetical protein